MFILYFALRAVDLSGIKTHFEIESVYVRMDTTEEGKDFLG